MRCPSVMLAAAAVVAASAVGGGCAVDDELSTPRPTVPTVVPVPDRTQPTDGDAEAGQTADHERTGDKRPDRDTTAGAAPASDEPAG
ncbi:MAG: hypothetical protein OXL98_01410, partial [Acidimicrobiaceae bacterium]|nr:hypothetical protein [Acidimicrobiaceae bacterium]